MSTHTCATPASIANLRRDGRPCERESVITIVGGPIVMGSLGLPTVMTDLNGEFIGFLFLDTDKHHAVQVWLAGDDTFTIERCRDGAVIGRLASIHLENVQELAWRASCFQDSEFGGHDPTVTAKRAGAAE